MTESHPQSNGYPHPPAPPPSSSSASAAAAAHAPSDTRTDAHSTLKSISSSSLIFDGVPLHGRIALLVLDLQEHFRRVSQTILSNLLPLIRLCQSPEHCETTIVIFTQHGHEINATEEEDGELGRRIGRENLIRYGNTPSYAMRPARNNTMCRMTQVEVDTHDSSLLCLVS